MRAMLCGCGRRLEARDDEGLVREALAHYEDGHAAAPVDGEYARRIVEERSYGLEYAVVYADGEDTDEEFGPEPY